MSIATNGNVGVGISNPTQKLSVSGTGTVRALVNSDLNAGFGLGLNNQQKWSVATVDPGSFQIFNEVLGRNALFINGASNNVAIDTNPANAKLTISANGNGIYVAGTPAGNFVGEFGEHGDFAIDSDSPFTVGGRFRVMEDSTVLINNPQATLTDNSVKLVVNGAIRAFLMRCKQFPKFRSLAAGNLDGLMKTCFRVNPYRGGSQILVGRHTSFPRGRARFDPICALSNRRNLAQRCSETPEKRRLYEPQNRFAILALTLV